MPERSHADHALHVAAHPTLVRIGRAIRRLRTEASATQASLAERSNLAVETISRLESGLADVSVLRLEKLAVSGLKVPLTVLFEPAVRTARPKMRPSLKRVVSLLEDLSDDDLDDVYVGLQRLLGVRAQRAKARTTAKKVSRGSKGPT